MFLTFLLSLVVSLYFLADYLDSSFIYPSFPHSFPFLFPSFDITYIFKLVSTFLHLSLPSILSSSFPNPLNHIRIQITFLPSSILALIPFLLVSHPLKTLHIQLVSFFYPSILSFIPFLSFSHPSKSYTY